LVERLVELALELVARGRGRGQQLGHVRAQLPRLRIDNLELLLNADGEGVRHHRIIVHAERGEEAARRKGTGWYPADGLPCSPTATFHPGVSPDSRSSR